MVRVTVLPVVIGIEQPTEPEMSIATPASFFGDMRAAQALPPHSVVEMETTI